MIAGGRDCENCDGTGTGTVKGGDDGQGHAEMLTCPECGDGDDSVDGADGSFDHLGSRQLMPTIHDDMPTVRGEEG